MDYLNSNYKNIFLKEGCNTFELFFVQSLQPLTYTLLSSFLDG